MERVTTGLSCPEEIFKAYSGLVISWDSVRRSVKDLYGLSLQFISQKFKEWLNDKTVDGNVVLRILETARKSSHRDFIVGSYDLKMWTAGEGKDNGWINVGGLVFENSRFPGFIMRGTDYGTYCTIKPPYLTTKRQYLLNNSYERLMRRKCKEFAEKVLEEQRAKPRLQMVYW